MPELRDEERIFDHDHLNNRSLPEARERYLLDINTLTRRPYASLGLVELQALAAVRGVAVFNAQDAAALPVEDDYFEPLVAYDEAHGLPDDAEQPLEREVQQQLRGFLADAPRMDPQEGARHFTRQNGRAWLTRHVHTSIGLWLQGPDGLMVSWRDVARYEVLDGRTLAEHEAAGGMIAGKPRDLYRGDIVGLATPEAEFMAHARSDVDALRTLAAAVAGDLPPSVEDLATAVGKALRS